LEKFPLAQIGLAARKGAFSKPATTEANSNRMKKTE
jgi:hypothetical protein